MQKIIITAGASLRDLIRFETSGALRVRLSNGASDLTTNRLFRDVSAWYHLVIRFDTTQATASIELKFMLMVLKKHHFQLQLIHLKINIEIRNANPNHIGMIANKQIYI